MAEPIVRIGELVEQPALAVALHLLGQLGGRKVARRRVDPGAGPVHGRGDGPSVYAIRDAMGETMMSHVGIFRDGTELEQAVATQSAEVAELQALIAAGADPTEIAEALADRIYVTDDNPRREDGARIREDILDGMRQPDQALVVADRAQAIRQIINDAGQDDLVLIAGKGNETSQQVGDLKIPFSDREQVLSALAGDRE